MENRLHRLFLVSVLIAGLLNGSIVFSQTRADLNSETKRAQPETAVRGNSQGLWDGRGSIDDPFVGENLSPDLKEALQKLDPKSEVSVILQSDDIDDPELRGLIAAYGGKVRSEARNLQMLEIEATLDAVLAIAASPRALHISSNLKTKSFGHIETTTGLQTLREAPATQNLTGTGVGIAIIDSGIFSEHDMFSGTSVASRVVKEEQFTLGGSEDRDGHGTHVAAIAAGRGGRPGSLNRQTYCGPIRVLPGREHHLAACFDRLREQGSRPTLSRL